MTRSIPVFDPRGPAGERRGFVLAGSWPDASPGSGEAPGYTMWAGPKAVIINAVLPGIDLDALQIRVAGKFLTFSGTLRPEQNGRRRASDRSNDFRRTVELPCFVDADRAEVRKEKGLISVVLKKEADPAGRRLESAILDSARRYFGADGPLRKTLEEEEVILQALDRYFSFLRGMNAPQGKRTP